MKSNSHLVKAHQYSIDQGYRHHLLEVFHGRVLVDLFHDEVGDKLGDVPSKQNVEIPFEFGRKTQIVGSMIHASMHST